jgi:uncharacterized protein (DUF2147 family)
MRLILTNIAALAATAAAPAAASSQTTLEGRWANAKRSVIVAVERCGEAWCGKVHWASDNNRREGATPGTTVLSDMRPQCGGVYKGRAYEPKRNIRGSATVHQVGPNTMVVKGCAVAGLICREQRWTRVGG